MLIYSVACAVLLLLQPPPSDEAGPRLYIWKEGRRPEMYAPSGCMPDGRGIQQQVEATEMPHSKPFFIRIKCDLNANPDQWVGAYFLQNGPTPQWRPKQTLDLFKALNAKPGDDVRCRFWVRSTDTVSVVFRVGGITRDGKPMESLEKAATIKTTLAPQWQQREIELKGADISRLIGPFGWTVSGLENEKKQVSFDLDTIYFVKVKPGEAQSANHK